jgi:SRSO17 transposase
MIDWHLFLPGSWTGDKDRMARVGVPAAHQEPCTKPQMALAEIDRVITTGLRFGTILADAGYGLSAPWR